MYLRASCKKKKWYRLTYIDFFFLPVVVVGWSAYLYIFTKQLLTSTGSITAFTMQVERSEMPVSWNVDVEAKNITFTKIDDWHFSYVKLYVIK